MSGKENGTGNQNDTITSRGNSGKGPVDSASYQLLGKKILGRLKDRYPSFYPKEDV